MRVCCRTSPWAFLIITQVYSRERFNVRLSGRQHGAILIPACRLLLSSIYNSSVPPQFDVAGVGLNATDTLLVVPRFPAYAGKVPFEEEIVSPGGQVASAMAACARLGLRTKYIGTIGDDERGRIPLASLRAAGINVDQVPRRAGGGHKGGPGAGARASPKSVALHPHRPRPGRAPGAGAAPGVPAPPPRRD